MTPNDSESLLNTLRRKILVRGLVVIFISSLAAIAVVLVKLDVILDQMQLLISYQKPGLRSWSESFTSTFLYQIHPFISIAAAYSAYLALRGKDTRYIIIAWLMVIVLVLQIKRIRYIIMVFPMISLMASYGLRRIEEKTVRTFLVSSIIVYALVIAYFGYLPFLKSTSPVNLKYAGRYLDSIPEAGVEVFTQMPRDPVASAVIQVPILDYFTEKEITYRYQDKDREISRSGIEASSLRFSWEYRSPPYYATSAEKNDDHAVAIITDDSARPVPDAIAERLTGFYLAKTFDTDEKVFRLRTHVLVFRKGREE